MVENRTSIDVSHQLSPPSEKFDIDVQTLRATKAGVTLVYSHPTLLATDWRVYLPSDDPAEEERRKAIRREMSDILEPFTARDREFVKEAREHGCEVDKTIGNAGLFPIRGSFTEVEIKVISKP